MAAHWIHCLLIKYNYSVIPKVIALYSAEKQQLFAKFIQKNSEGRWEVTLTKGTRDIGKLICESGMAISKSFAARYAPQASLDGFSPTATTPTHSITNDVQSHSFPSNQVSIIHTLVQ